MSRFLLDSNVCIACLRRKPWALKVLGSVPLASVAVSSLTVGELVLGAHLSEDQARELAKVEAFLRPIQILPFGRDEAFQWASLDAQLRKQGNRIEAEDAMIAATAMALGMTLVSGNTKHFERVKGLSPEQERRATLPQAKPIGRGPWMGLVKVVDWEHRPPV